MILEQGVFLNNVQTSEVTKDIFYIYYKLYIYIYIYNILVMGEEDPCTVLGSKKSSWENIYHTNASKGLTPSIYKALFTKTPGKNEQKPGKGIYRKRYTWFKNMLRRHSNSQQRNMFKCSHFWTYHIGKDGKGGWSKGSGGGGRGRRLGLAHSRQTRCCLQAVWKAIQSCLLSSSHCISQTLSKNAHTCVQNTHPTT